MIENPRVRIRIAAVLTASALAVVGLEARRRSMPLEPPLPSGAVRIIERLKLVAPLGEVLAPPSELVWEPVSGAARYQVTLRAVDGSELWSQILASHRAAIPAPVRQRIVNRKTLVWKVAAHDAGGAVLRESEHARFRVEPTAAGVN